MIDPEMCGRVGAHGESAEHRFLWFFQQATSYPPLCCLREGLRFPLRERGMGLGEQK